MQPLVKEVKVNKKDYLYIPIKTIYNIFKDKLNFAEIKIIENGFKANNSVKQLCEGKKTPLVYEDIEKINTEMSLGDVNQYNLSTHIDRKKVDFRHEKKGFV